MMDIGWKNVSSYFASVMSEIGEGLLHGHIEHVHIVPVLDKIRESRKARKVNQ